MRSAIGLRPLAKPIDARGNSRIFNINDRNNRNDISVFIEGLTITGEFSYQLSVISHQ